MARPGPVVLILVRGGFRTLRVFGLVLLVAAAASGAALRAVGQDRGPLHGRTIAVDAGHGGYDPGAVDSRGLLEKDLTLDIARRLAARLGKSGARVVMTRESDTDFVNWSLTGSRPRKLSDLDFRIALARGGQAEILVSIHANKAPNAAYFGPEVFYDPESAGSRDLAEAIQSELQSASLTGRTAKPASYYLTRNAPMPAVIVEVGYLSNPRESELLRDPRHRGRLAESIEAGIKAYFTPTDD